MPAKLLQQKTVAHLNLFTMKPHWTKKMRFTERNISNRHTANDIFGTVARAISQAKEANRAESKNDFIHKVSISTKEAAETEFWLELVSESKHLKTQGSCEVLSESRELLAILTTIGRNTKAGKAGTVEK
jgi:cysteinyl-tRNA synthetase